jgi:hypothetical protein
MHGSHTKESPMPRKPASRAPEKPATKIYTFMLPVALINEIDALARAEHRSRTQQVSVLLDWAVHLANEEPKYSPSRPARKRGA